MAVGKKVERNERNKGKPTKKSGNEIEKLEEKESNAINQSIKKQIK